MMLLPLFADAVFMRHASFAAIFFMPCQRRYAARAIAAGAICCHMPRYAGAMLTLMPREFTRDTTLRC